MDAFDLHQSDAEFLLKVEHLVNIRKVSIFNFVSVKQSKSLIRDHTILETYEPGEKIRRSSKNDEVYVVARGVVNLVAHNDVNKIVGKVSQGRCIELGRSLLLRKFEFDWIADDSVSIFRINAKALFAEMEENGALAYLQRITQHTLFYSVIKALRICGLNQKQLIKAVAAFEHVGEKSATEAFAGGFVGILIDGQCRINGWINGQHKNVTTIRAGRLSTFQPIDGTKIELEFSSAAKIWLLPFSRLREICDDSVFNSVVDFHDLVKPTLESLQDIETSPRQHVSAGAPARDDDDELEIHDFEVSESEQKALKSQKRFNIRQYETIDCGAASLATVCRFYGKKVRVSDVRPLVDVGQSGASMLSMKAGAKKLGFDSCGIYARRIDSLKNIRIPFIAVCDYHYVVVYDFNESHVTVADPGMEKVFKQTREVFDAQFSGNVLCLKPGSDFSADDISKDSYLKYFAIFRGHWWIFTQMCLLALVEFVVGMGSPLLQQVIFDEMVSDPSEVTIKILAVALVSLSVTGQIVRLLQQYLSVHLGSAVDAKFSALFMRHLFRLPLSYFSVRRTGDISMRVDQLGTIQGFLTSQPVNLVLQMMTLVMYSAVLYLYHPGLVLIIASVVPFYILFIKKMTPLLTENRQKVLKNTVRLNSIVVEQVQGLEAIQSINGAVAARWRWSQAAYEKMNLAMQAVKLEVLFHTVSKFIKSSLNQIVFFMAIYWFLKQELSIGQVIAVSAISGQILAPLVGLLNQWDSFNAVGIAFGRVDDVFTTPPEENDRKEPLPVPFEPSIEFKNVSFRYGGLDSELVLQGVNLKILPGETVAIVGRSGSGKSTLAYLINGLYKATSGTVLVGNKDVTEVRIAELRQKIAFIMQENVLFSGTIIENIALGQDNPDFEKVKYCAKLANADEFITKMPQQYFTMLGESGGGLSGGQKQRINIARALFTSPGILIMDEATSALDGISERAIMESMSQLDARITRIIIAHRLNTVMGADRIIVMDKGHLIEQGNHSDLINRRGTYYELFKRQLI